MEYGFNELDEEVTEYSGHVQTDITRLEDLAHAEIEALTRSLAEIGNYATGADRVIENYGQLANFICPDQMQDQEPESHTAGLRFSLGDLDTHARTKLVDSEHKQHYRSVYRVASRTGDQLGDIPPKQKWFVVLFYVTFCTFVSDDDMRALAKKYGWTLAFAIVASYMKQVLLFRIRCVVLEVTSLVRKFWRMKEIIDSPLSDAEAMANLRALFA